MHYGTLCLGGDDGPIEQMPPRSQSPSAPLPPPSCSGPLTSAEATLNLVVICDPRTCFLLSLNIFINESIESMELKIQRLCENRGILTFFLLLCEISPRSHGHTASEDEVHDHILYWDSSSFYTFVIFFPIPLLLLTSAVSPQLTTSKKRSHI